MCSPLGRFEIVPVQGPANLVHPHRTVGQEKLNNLLGKTWTAPLF